MDDLLKRAMPSNSNLERVLNATGDLGKASGLDVAVQVLRALAEEGPKVDAVEILAAAESLDRSAHKLRTSAQAVLSNY